MVLKSLDGPVLAQEIDAFKAFITGLVPAADNIGNTWAQGNSGRELKAMGMVYELSGDVKILQKMIVYCDALLAQRNDKAPAPAGQRQVWTGTIAPVWPNEVTTGLASAGAEQGDAIGHLGYCGKLILKSSALAALAVPGGDPHGYGNTYRERAKTYVKEGDRSIKEFILPNLLASDSNGLYRFSMTSPYKTGLAVPWNQQMMLNYAFMNLADAHHLLNDAAADEKTYRQIVAVNIASFFTTGAKSYRNSAGRQSYGWGYSLPAVAGEDGNHGALDVAGLYRAFDNGSYGVTAAQMNTLANTFVDVMILGPKKYAGRVDGTSGTGHAAETTYIRSAYLLLAQFRPDAYQAMVSADLAAGAGTGAADLYATILWLKHKRAP